MPRQNTAGKVGNYATSLTREIKAPVRVQLARGRTGVDRTSAANVIIVVPCAGGHDVEIGFNQMFPPEVVRKKMTQAKWDFHHGPLCPACVAKTRADPKKPALKLVPPAPPPAPEQDLDPTPEAPEKEVPMETSATAIASATAQLTPTAKAKAARRAVMTWLEESFDLTGPDKGRYKAGISDASIAKETGCSEDAVKKIREEFFGVLDKPKELDAISVEVGNLRIAAAELEKRASEHAERMVADARAEAAVIRQRADKLAERLAHISKQQGWS